MNDRNIKVAWLIGDSLRNTDIETKLRKRGYLTINFYPNCYALQADEQPNLIIFSEDHRRTDASMIKFKEFFPTAIVISLVQPPPAEHAVSTQPLPENFQHSLARLILAIQRIEDAKED
ncbi:MAG: hypothetical protein ACOYXT_24665 [Bacteroidota bacterium]